MARLSGDALPFAVRRDDATGTRLAAYVGACDPEGGTSAVDGAILAGRKRECGSVEVCS